MPDADGPLSQSEIDALLASLAAGASAPATPPPPPPKPEAPAEPTMAATPPPTAPADAEASAEDAAYAVSGPPPLPEEPPSGRVQRITDLSVTFTVVVGQTSQPMQRWLELGIGSRIVLNQKWQQPVTLRLNGMAVGTGRVVLVGNRFGVKVTRWGNQQ